MINKITVELDLPDSIRFQYLGSILHGVLMDYLPNDIADQLHHEFAYSPLKQRIYHKNKKVIWEIVCMSDRLFNEIAELFTSKNRLFLKYYQVYIEIYSFNIEKVNVQNIMNQLLETEELNRYVRINIVDYKLKSTRFNLEKVKIPSFTGEIVFKIKGPLPFLQLTHFLLKFGEFSGSGMKTSLGMGKYSII
ncbi:CRISPR system precrRNA processing endoribonuclease RAMP protein Cas6 [Staphylococcus aureus]|nr:CRISPR system precrRNA processing endoribonuclease RAMP protein Cas6 [Staphylococcus aureus]